MSQVMVPVGMSDLLDDWVWSPDAARWEPDADLEEERSWGLSRVHTINVGIDVQALYDVMRRLTEIAGQAADSFARLRLGVSTHLEILDETHVLVVPHPRFSREVPVAERETASSSPPTDVRERALWLRQHRNTGPARPPGTWY